IRAAIRKYCRQQRIHKLRPTETCRILSKKLCPLRKGIGQGQLLLGQVSPANHARPVLDKRHITGQLWYLGVRTWLQVSVRRSIQPKNIGTRLLELWLEEESVCDHNAPGDNAKQVRIATRDPAVRVFRPVIEASLVRLAVLKVVV